MKPLVTIIITADYKEKFLNNGLNSLVNQTLRNYQVIILFSKLDNLFYTKKKFKKFKFIKIKKKFSNPIHDQLYKIKEGIKYAKGEYIFLLDGDDYYHKRKLSIMVNFLKKYPDYLIQDSHYQIDNKIRVKYKKSKVNQNNRFANLFINNWPKNICTSTQALSKESFNFFFEHNSPFKWKNLAIDIQLAIFFFYRRKIMNIPNFLTYKFNDPQSVDKIYNRLFSKKYWERRFEQHKYTFSFKSNKGFSLDYFFSKIMSKIVNYL